MTELSDKILKAVVGLDHPMHLVNYWMGIGEASMHFVISKQRCNSVHFNDSLNLVSYFGMYCCKFVSLK